MLKEGSDGAAQEARLLYNLAKRNAKHVVWRAKSEAAENKFRSISVNENEIFRIAKQMDRSSQDVVGDKCIQNDAGELSLSDSKKLKAWVEHYLRPLNVEFDWPSEALDEVPALNEVLYGNCGNGQ